MFDMMVRKFLNVVFKFYSFLTPSLEAFLLETLEDECSDPTHTAKPGKADSAER